MGWLIPEPWWTCPHFPVEIKYNIDWMLKLQDPGDGGCWHKSTTPNFCPFIMPEADNEMPVVVIGSVNPPHKITTATANFAAVCAQASRVYRENWMPNSRVNASQQPSLARDGWLGKSTPDNIYQNPPHIRTGGYGDDDPSDERLWAAAELFRATGNAIYHDYFKAHWTNWNPPIQSDRPQTWRSVANMGMYAYLFAAGNKTQKWVVLISRAALSAADQIVERTKADGYHNPMLAKDYVWGSNSEILNYAMMLLIADTLEDDPGYYNCAIESLHYIFGCNTFNISFVTHVGSKWPMHPHHRPSGADGIEQPWPGLLLGGPNARGQEKPATHWNDIEEDASITENAINWQAPLVFVLAAALPD